MDINQALKLLEEGEIKLAENCSLCGRKADSVGLFIASEDFAKKIGQPEGKQQIAFYPGCSRCQEKLGMNEYMARIELVMQADTKG
jgi:hypothetical protein